MLKHWVARGVSVCPVYGQRHRREIPVRADRHSTDLLARTQLCSVPQLPIELSIDGKSQDITRLSGQHERRSSVIWAGHGGISMTASYGVSPCIYILIHLRSIY